MARKQKSVGCWMLFARLNLHLSIHPRQHLLHSISIISIIMSYISQALFGQDGNAISPFHPATTKPRSAEEWENRKELAVAHFVSCPRLMSLQPASNLLEQYGRLTGFVIPPIDFSIKQSSSRVLTSSSSGPKLRLQAEAELTMQALLILSGGEPRYLSRLAYLLRLFASERPHSADFGISQHSWHLGSR